VQSGGTTTVAGGITFDTGAFTLNGGTLNGTGTIGGPVTNNNGTVAPGNSPGALSMSGSYIQNAGGTLQIAVTDTSTYSTLSVGGNVTVGGALVLVPSAGYQASVAIADRFHVVTYVGSLTGTFGTVNANPPFPQGNSVAADYATTPKTVDAVIGSSTATYTLTLSKSGSGSGTVTSSPPGISCGATCSHKFVYGTPVTLTAAPDPGSSVSGWSVGGCSGTTCQVIVNSDTGVTVTFTLAPPANSTAPSVAGTPSPGQSLTCNHGAWTNNPTGYSYQWKRDGSAISGANSQNYTVQTGDQGHDLTCAVIASNGAGSSGPVTSAPFNIPQAIPNNTSTPSITGTPLPGNTLTCHAGSWGSSPISFSYQWTRDGLAIPGATGQQYQVQIADEGHTLGCDVTASNGGGASGAVASTGAIVAQPGTLNCPKPTGGISGRSLGPLALAMTQKQAGRILTRFTSLGGGFKIFCLFGGWGIRVGYPTSKLLRSVPHGTRSSLSGKIVIELTGNPFYSLNGVSPGMPSSVAVKALHLSKPFHITNNFWYFTSDGSATGVVKVTAGVVQEVGLVSKLFSATHAAQKFLLASWGSLPWGHEPP
jgi:hypothetical protein